MEPSDVSNSLIRRATKRVFEYLPNAWRNMLFGKSKAGDDEALSSNENDDQPFMKKLCSLDNTSTNMDNRYCLDPNSPDTYRSSHTNVLLPEISAATCLPSTSKQSPKFTHQSNSSTSNPVIDSKRENESHPLLKSQETTTKHRITYPQALPSFKWDTFFNHGELSERKKQFARKSPLNCSQLIRLDGLSGFSNLSKVLCDSPSKREKTTIPVSPTINNEINTISSVLLDHITTKNKEIEENAFIIPPRTHLMNEADQKDVSVTLDTTVNDD